MVSLSDSCEKVKRGGFYWLIIWMIIIFIFQKILPKDHTKGQDQELSSHWIKTKGIEKSFNKIP